MADQKQQDLKVKVLDTKPCSITLNVEVPHGEVLCETDKAYEEVHKVAKIPGFRPGKAPMDMVKKNYTEAVREKVIENLLQKTVFKALESQNFNPLNIPTIHEMNFDFEKPFIFTVKAEKHPEFKVKDYKGIKVKKEINIINDEQVSKTLEGLRERNASLVESKSESAGPDSFLTVDYDCFLSLEPLNELSEKNQMIDLGSKQIIAGFREGLTGAKKGEERSIKSKFPEDYPNKKIAGKEVNFRVKILEVKDKILPNLDDEFAKDLGAENLNDLKTKIKESLEHEEKRRENEDVEKQIFDYLLKSNDFPLPESLIEEQKSALIERMTNYLKRQGVSQDMINKNVEQQKEKYVKDAENTVKLSYILGAIAKDEKIDVTEDELKEEYEKIKKANPSKEKEVEKYLNENKNNIRTGIKEEKIYKFLIDNAKITETTKR
ncbi:MAG: trigger factor [Elusimicrobia bacterium]|nr:trigger factor [Elusimicrobiota bacterium]